MYAIRTNAEGQFVIETSPGRELPISLIADGDGHVQWGILREAEPEED